MTDADRRAVLDALARFLDGLPVEAKVTVRFAGTRAAFTVPAPAAARAEGMLLDCGLPDRGDPPARVQAQPPGTDCRADVLRVLKEAGRRLSGSQIVAELDARGWRYGERELRRLCREGVLDNPRARGRSGRHLGYYFAGPTRGGVT